MTTSTQAELNILSKRLEDVNEKIQDESNASQMASLVTQKRAIELEMEEVKQRSAVQATEAKVKILEAELDAAEKAAEAEAERLELLEKLADASREFARDLKEIQRNFNDFADQRFADLLEEEASARSDLKDAQQGVLDSTQGLHDAYRDLIDAQLSFNGAIAEARIKSNLLARDIGALTGDVVTFDQGLNTLGNAFTSVLRDSNITLEKRISLERQLAEETLTFLQQARDQIVSAGIGIFGQTGAENQALGRGIEGLKLIADQLGGSFDAFLNLGQGEIAELSNNLLNLPVEFRQQILDALSFLPNTTNIGGFSVDQLRQAIGQVGAGIAPEAGLPSIEELNASQVEQLEKITRVSYQRC